MSNAKRFLSVMLAIIMVCSTLVIGASAAYNAYKNEAIVNYNQLDEPVLSIAQYASAAMDEVDRMLDEAQIKMTKDQLFGIGELDVTSIDAAMNSVYDLIKGQAFAIFKGQLGALGDLSVDAFSRNNVRRDTEGKTDADVIYAVLQFLYDNKNIFVKFIQNDLDLGSLGSILSGVGVDISEYQDINKLLKSLLYGVIYKDEEGNKLEVPDNVGNIPIDTMVQDLIDNLVPTITMDGRNIGHYFENHTNISAGSAYDILDKLIQDAYNGIAVYVLNNAAKKGINKFCGAEYDEDDVRDLSNLNGREILFNLDYELSEYNFDSSKTTVEQLNALIKNIMDQMLNPAVYTWVGGNNSNLKNNIVNLAKAVLTATGDEFFASYVEVASPAELDAMTDQELTAYALRAIINASVDGMYIPDEATTLRSFGYYTLSQLLATAIPELDFSGLNKNSTDSLIVMGINYAIYAVSAEIDMGLSYVHNMSEVDAQLAVAANYAIDNYGGLFSGINFSGCNGGWELIDAILFHIINPNWLPASANGSSETFVIDCLVNNILDLNINALLNLFQYRADSELQNVPKVVLIKRIASIVNMIFPGALNGNATTIEALITNQALASTVNVLFTTLYTERVNLVKSILPTLCSILDLTNKQAFKFPALTYDKMVYTNSGIFDFNVKIRNNSTGINTAWTDVNGVRHQDMLYTYDIKSITCSTNGNSTMEVKSSPSSITGGTTELIRLNGGIDNTTDILKVVITYDILTETGEPLTASPINEDVYVYLTKTASQEGETIVTTSATNGMVISDGPKNVFATSMKDITSIALTIKNSSATDKTVTATSNVFTKAANPKDENGTYWFELNPASVTIPQKIADDNPGIGHVSIFKTTDAYNALTGEEKQEAWQSMIRAMTTKRNGKITSYPKTTNYTLGVTGGPSYASANLYVYDDFGLESVVNSELSKHRLASSYSSSEAWAAYQTALLNAVEAVYSPFVTATFASVTGKASKYEAASTALTEAIEALEETALSAGVDSLQEIIDMYNPENEEGVEYDDPDYTFFSVDDFVAYTYYNYRDEYRTAKKMIDKATTPDEETGEYAIINELDKVYTQHRLSLYGQRLLPKVANKTHLEAELNNLTRTTVYNEEWSAESWANFQRAYTFANSVVNAEASTLRQSKINTALEELLEAEKRLVKGNGTVEPGDEPTFELVDPTGEGELTVIEAESGLILTGISPDFDAEDFFDCKGCYIDVTTNAMGVFATGAVVDVISEATGETLYTYTIAIFGDVNGDSQITTDDSVSTIGLSLGSIAPSDHAKFAADVNSDGASDTSDAVILLGACLGSRVIDHVNCTVS